MDRKVDVKVKPARHYNVLDHSEDEIRLLQVDLTGTDHRLLENISLRTRQPPYCALSYNWGNEKDTRDIQVNGESLPVSLNLYQALQEVITFWKITYSRSRKPLLLWCDQYVLSCSLLSSNLKIVADPSIS